MIVRPPAGSVCMLTTRAVDGRLRSRPVTVFHGADDAEVTIFTAASARKVTDISSDPAVTLAGPVADGWWSAEGSASIDQDATSELAAAGIPIAPSSCVLRVRLQLVRQWTMHSSQPWDNTVEEWELTSR